MSHFQHPDIPPARFHEYSGDLTMRVSIAFIVMEILAVGLRYTSLLLSEKSFGVDDFLILPGLVVCLGLDINGILGVQLGRVGWHLDVVKVIDPEALIPWANILLVCPILYSAACMIPRVVILTLYLRVFNEKGYRIACYILMGLVISLGVADILTGALECIPVQYLWDKSISGHCIDLPLFFRWGTLPNVIMDFLMLILPQPVIWKLQVSKQVKIGLAVTILTGSVGMITSIIRCVAFFQHDPLEDGTWASVTFVNWSIIEPGVYLLAACLPCYRPLIKALCQRRPRGSPNHSADTYLDISDSKGLEGSWKTGSGRTIDNINELEMHNYPETRARSL
ncbi:hypothetical protein BDV30DRAFT_250951 [Aspergillus minisclerotigenes]|uniref:Rhodopsin domain-containing protein n=1 Tax=Aspergillus minisclerotigenes TaxID=656917 RepID=A0A5N6IXR7_9EURO|nr:hypothetical protein BDV30DRAFT_250951 [Aspergillus minisclerotigenes]